MSKYTPEQLKTMAQQWVVDHTAGGEKSFRVVMTIAMVTGLAVDEIVNRIEAMASGVDCHA